MHGAETGVQSPATDEADRIDVPTPLSPMVARQLARRRADRPRHLPQSAADEPARRLPTGPGAVAFAGVLLLILVLGVAVVALWPQGSGDDGELVATDVPTTEPYPDSDEAASRRAARSPSSTDGDDAPATTGSTDEATTSTGSTGSTSTTGDGTSTTAEPGTSTTGPATSSPSTSSPSTSNPSTSSSSTSNPSTSNPPSTSPPPASTAPSTSPTTAPPAPGDPDQAATWYRLAECETDGNWSYRDDGRYGGLRIRDEDWRDHGGTGYPHQHSAETQITIARRIQADEGWSYWRHCARRLGYM